MTYSVGTEDGAGQALDDISREIVMIHARFYGRGPSRAKTVWQRNVVTCVLEDIYTNTEALLIARGHFGEVRSSRIVFQDDVEPLFRAVVETATGASVRSFLSQVSIDGVASEVFILDAAGESNGPRP